VTRLSDHAHRYLAALSKATLESRTAIVATGRSYRPTNTTHILIIAAVASEDLRRRSDNAADEPIQDSLNSGVWVCTGHGMYRMSLRMGSGKLLSEMILEEKLGVDISMLGFRRVRRTENQWRLYLKFEFSN
jgi:glycine/D-amino acid oxidase-like deaminating enzyme